MRQDLDDQLCRDYPEIFRDRRAPMTQTAMCWGFACGDGWYALLDECCRLLVADLRTVEKDIAQQQHSTAHPEHQSDWARQYYTPERLATLEAKRAALREQVPVATQVKEKYGGLRFYVTAATDEQYAYIRFAEAMSYRICESCGTTANVRVFGRWVRTRCATCADAEGVKHEYDAAT